MFERVFIANRGAVARRVVRACDALGIASVAAYSDVDGQAPHLAEASATARLRGYKPQDTYLDAEAVLRAARHSGADALHPGYGFLAENAAFARRVEESGIRFIGPAPKWLEMMGEKTRAREIMAAHDFPVHAGSSVLNTPDEALEAARDIGYPVMLKAAQGGGGIGMAVVEDEAQLVGAYHRAVSLAGRAFAADDVYLERYLERPRHIEFQILGDGEAVVSLFERECSIQRRHQKLIEEAPAPNVDRDRLAQVARHACTVLTDIGYDNLGTVETLLCGDTIGFLEMNTRLQVEHGVTEEATGVDIVGAQIRLASGAALNEVLPDDPSLIRHAVEARVYAEDAVTHLPSTGRLQVFRPPNMTGVRIDAGYAEGQVVTPYYDPLIAKVIGSGATREQAIGRTLIALKAFSVTGIDTNIALLRRVLESEAFLAGNLHTEFLDDLL